MHGVSFTKLDYQIAHGIYADNIHMIIQDDHAKIELCLDLFSRFGEASGLICDWQKMHVVYLSDKDIPEHLMEHGWIWDDNLLRTRLLGIHISDEIVPGLMVEHLRVKLENGL